jgi:hypothetical protein
MNYPVYGRSRLIRAAALICTKAVPGSNPNWSTERLEDIGGCPQSL